jgi:hypothetical protein
MNIVTTAPMPILMMRNIISPANPIRLNTSGIKSLNTAMIAKMITSHIKRFSNHVKSKHMIISRFIRQFLLRYHSLGSLPPSVSIVPAAAEQ